MKIALVSPLPPAPSGVADYSATLQKELSRHATVNAFEHPKVKALRSYEACLYHIGNNSLHGPAYEAALEVPGVVVLHDAVLHHFLLGRLPREAYIEEFVFNYTEWMRQMAEELWRERALSAGDYRYFQYPMLRRLVDSAKAVIVHNPKARRFACEAAEADSRDLPVLEIPHFVEPPELPDAAEQTATRERLGILKDALVIGSFGYQRPSKRLRSVLTAARALTVPYCVLIVGDFVEEEYLATLEPLIAGAPVIRIPYVARDEFWRLVAITDVCVNLRYPSAGESSGIAMKLMAAGRTVIVTEGEENSALPGSAVLKVDPGEGEVEMLACYLCTLANDREMRDYLGGNAAEFMASEHSLKTIGERYMESIRRAVGASS